MKVVCRTFGLWMVKCVTSVGQVNGAGDNKWCQIIGMTNSAGDSKWCCGQQTNTL